VPHIRSTLKLRIGPARQRDHGREHSGRGERTIANRGVTFSRRYLLNETGLIGDLANSSGRSGSFEPIRLNPCGRRRKASSLMDAVTRH
jgi:hypothetical protein